jgi:hypothetical protein
MPLLSAELIRKISVVVKVFQVQWTHDPVASPLWQNGLSSDVFSGGEVCIRDYEIACGTRLMRLFEANQHFGGRHISK